MESRMVVPARCAAAGAVIDTAAIIAIATRRHLPNISTFMDCSALVSASPLDHCTAHARKRNSALTNALPASTFARHSVQRSVMLRNAFHSLNHVCAAALSLAASAVVADAQRQTGSPRLDLQLAPLKVVDV